MHRGQSLLGQIRLRLTSQEGYVMIIAVFTVGLVMISGLAVLGRATTEQRMSRRHVDLEQAAYAAMAGVEACMGYIVYNEDSNPLLEMPDPDNPPTHNICDETVTIGDSAYEVTAEYLTKDEIEVRAVGWSASNPSITRVAMARLGVPDDPTKKYLADIEAQSITWGSGDFTIQSNGTFQGSIFVKGTITISGTPDLCGVFYATGTVVGQGNVGSTPTAYGCPYAFDDPETVDPNDTRTYDFRPNSPEIEIPEFDFTIDDADEIAPMNNGPNGFTPICPDTWAIETLPSYCVGPTGDSVKIVWVPGDLIMDKYKPTGVGQPEDKFRFYGNLVFVVDGNGVVQGDITSKNVSVNYGTLSTPDGPEVARVQFMSLNGNVDIQGDNNSGTSRTVNGVFVAPSTVSGKGKVSTSNVLLKGMVFANHWYAGGPTDHVASGRVWVTKYGFYDNYVKVLVDADGDGIPDGPADDPDGWTINGFWHE